MNAVEMNDLFCLLFGKIFPSIGVFTGSWQISGRCEFVTRKGGFWSGTFVALCQQKQTDAFKTNNRLLLQRDMATCSRRGGDKEIFSEFNAVWWAFYEAMRWDECDIRHLLRCQVPSKGKCFRNFGISSRWRKCVTKNPVKISPADVSRL